MWRNVLDKLEIGVYIVGFLAITMTFITLMRNGDVFSPSTCLLLKHQALVDSWVCGFVPLEQFSFYNRRCGRLVTSTLTPPSALYGTVRNLSGRLFGICVEPGGYRSRTIYGHLLPLQTWQISRRIVKKERCYYICCQRDCDVTMFLSSPLRGRCLHLGIFRKRTYR